jgi:hypothetical protein
LSNSVKLTHGEIAKATTCIYQKWNCPYCKKPFIVTETEV